MPDRERVIECLQKAKIVIEMWVPMFYQYNTPAGIDEAIALLKEQEAVEPKEAKFETFGSTRKCSNCNKYLFPAGRYCPHCSRPVRWDK